MLYANVTVTASGDTIIIPAVAGKKVRLHEYVVITDADVIFTWKDTAGTSLSGPLPLASYGGISSAPGAGSYQTPFGLMETSPNAGLVINLSGAVNIGGHITYTYVVY
jgi:hypothetical protein